MGDHDEFEELLSYLAKVPGVTGNIGSGTFDNGNWWVKFSLELSHPLAWHVVQELGSVLNYLSVDERLPTVFMPVSPPPYLNGGPREYLSWVIESKEPSFKPGKVAEWLGGRLPRPVDDLSQWEAQDGT